MSAKIIPGRCFKKRLQLQYTPNTPPWALGEGKNDVFFAFGRDQSAGLYIRLFERSINSPLGDCVHRFILTPTTHTPSVGNYYSCFKKLIRLQYTPNTPPWALGGGKNHVFYAFGRDQSAGLYIWLFERSINSPLLGRLR